MSFNRTLQRNATRGGAMMGAYPDGDAPVVNVAHVFIESGQSNSQGRGLRGDAPTGSDPGPIGSVQTWRRSQDGDMYSGAGAWHDLDYEWNQYEGRNEFGSILQFGLDMSAAIEDVNNTIYMIKADGNGKPISGWAEGGNEDVAMYAGHIEPALASLVADVGIDLILIHGFFWDQGESDAGDESLSLAYEANLIEVITRLRASINMPTLPVILRRMYTDQPFVYGENIRTAQANIEASDNDVYLIDGPYVYTDSNVHIDGDSQNTVGATRATIIQTATDGIIYNG